MINEQLAMRNQIFKWQTAEMRRNSEGFEGLGKEDQGSRILIFIYKSG